MWARSLLRCQQANEQQCLPNGSVVQHAGLLKQHLIRGCESLFHERLIVLFCIFNIPRCIRIHIHITGGSEGWWAEPVTCSLFPRYGPTLCLPGSVHVWTMFNVLSWPWETDYILHGSAARKPPTWIKKDDVCTSSHWTKMKPKYPIDNINENTVFKLKQKIEAKQEGEKSRRRDRDRSHRSNDINWL